MILGCPADVAGFAFLQCLLAQELGVKPGIYTHTVSNAHIYDTHYDIAKEIISRESKQQKINLLLPENSFSRAEKRDRELVEEVALNLEKQYTPLEAIKGIKIVL